MDQPILNPQNPYVGTLRIFPGTLVKVAGRARPNATRFAINFQTGPSLNPRDDLALHLSPCFTPPRIIRNSLMHGAWGIEEAWSNGSILSPHAPFEIMILAEPEQYKIAINGSHYCEFRHRIPYQQVTHLTVDGDVDIERISVVSDAYGQQQGSMPSYQPPQVPSAPASGSGMPPYPPAGGGPMPMPNSSMYPNLPPSNPMPSPHPGFPAHSTPAGPAPTPNSYASGYPASGPYPPQPPVGPYSTSGPYPPHPSAGPQPGPNAYGQMPPAGGPVPAPSGYSHGLPQQPHNQPQPGHSSSHTSTPFGNIPIGGKALGTIAGLGLGAAAGAAALSALNPVKTVKKMLKPKKMFKHKGWGRRSSSSSNSSRSSISSRSSRSSDSS